MPHPADQAPEHGREDAAGELWFTVRQAAALTGKALQTIYSWERRGLLDRHAARTDEAGRRIYTQAQIATAERSARHNTAAVRRVA